MKKQNKTSTTLMLIISTLMIFNVLSSCQKKQDKYIGIQLWSVRDSMKTAPEKTLQQLGDIGYGFIEAAGYDNGKFYGMNPADFKNLVESNGMEFLSSHTGHPLPDSSEWEETMKWWDQCIKAHKKAGVKYIVQPSMGGSAYQSLENLEAYCDYFNAIGKKCNENEIRFGYHNHDKEFTQLEGKTIYDFMLQNTDPEKVFFQMDLYWVVEGDAEPVDYFEKYPQRFELWHIKDEAELGASGKMDFESMFAKSDLAGMKYAIVEIEKYNYDPIKSAEISYDYLINADFTEQLFLLPENINIKPPR